VVGGPGLFALSCLGRPKSAGALRRWARSVAAI
jgi:hypothetical protein